MCPDNMYKILWPRILEDLFLFHDELTDICYSANVSLVGRGPLSNMLCSDDAGNSNI